MNAIEIKNFSKSYGSIEAVNNISLDIASGELFGLIGPDGAGKSTVNNLVLEQLARAFRRTNHFHWRPGLLPKLGRKRNNAATDSGDNDKPASTSKYGTVISFIRFAYYWFDFING